MRGRLIVNPNSGRNRAIGLLPAIHERLRTIVGELDISLTMNGEDVERAAERAVADKADALFVAGGDGTLNLALRALIRSGSARLPTIGIIPLGTGNDLVKSLGLGEEPLAAVDSILRGRVRSADLGIVNGRPFVNVSAGGFVADVSQVLTEELKDVAGKGAFLLGGARVLWSNQPFSARVDAVAPDKQRPVWLGQHPLRMFAVCNARFFGGGYPVAPEAALDDGLLDVFLVGDMGLLELVSVLQRIAAGTHLDDERVVQFRASSLRLTFDHPINVNADGEPFETDVCRYETRPRYISFFTGDPAPGFTASSSPGHPEDHGCRPDSPGR